MSAPLHALGQRDATENIGQQFLEEVTRAKGLIRDLERSLQRLDEAKEGLRGHGVSFEVDLGDVGNAAAAARRQVAKAPARTTFAYPAA